VRIFVSDCQDHQPFFSLAITDIAKTCFFLLFGGSTAKSASMASRCHLLAMYMHPNWALRALNNRIGQFWEITKASRTWRAYDMPRTFVVLWLLPSHIPLKGHHVQNWSKICLHEAIILISFNTLVIIERTDSFLTTSSFQIFYNQSTHVLILQLGIFLPKMIASKLIFPCQCWTNLAH